MNSFLAGNSFLTPHLFGFNTGREEINAKILQALENEALKVRDVKHLSSSQLFSRRAN